jgi:predicted amidohydrolase YtcJ
MRAVRQLVDHGEIATRFRHYPAVPWAVDPDQFASLADPPDDVDRYQVPGVKLFVDGQGGDGLDRQFDDLKYSQAELDNLVIKTDRVGLQAIMHAVTGSGIRMGARAILAADAAAGRDAGSNPLRHRIEHGADYADLSDLALLRRSGVVLVATPHFVQSESGASRPAAPLRTLVDAGVPIAGGTDTTGTVPEGASPLHNIWCSAARRPGHAERDERLTHLEALSLFTAWAAEAVPGEPDRGRLRVGALGDLAILSDNPLSVRADRLPTVTVDATVTGGQVVFTR